MLESTAAQIVGVILLAVTVALLVYASHWPRSATTRAAAVASILTGAGASLAIVTVYAGEKALEFAGGGTIVRRAMAGERGYFTFIDAAPAEADSAGGRRSKASRSAGGDDEPSSREPSVRLRDCPNCPELVTIPAGYVRIGATADDGDATAAERPARIVRFDKPFQITRTEITRAHYAVYLAETGRPQPTCSGLHPDRDPRAPVTCVSWREAYAYAAWLSRRTGLAYRLPSEAEWEHAARAGGSTRFVTGSTLPAGAANFARPDAYLVPVASFKPNGFGLHDVHGNAAELVADCWRASPAELPGNGSAARARVTCEARTLRDAGTGEPALAARLSARRPYPEDGRHPTIGFRLVREMR